MASLDAAVTGDDAITRNLLCVHTEVAAAMGDELIDFLEAAFVEEQFDAFAGGQSCRRDAAAQAARCRRRRASNA